MDNNLSYKAGLLGAGKPWVLLLVWTFVMMAALGCSVTIGTRQPCSSEEENELQQAYEQFSEAWAEAEKTFDASCLEAVATGEALREGQAAIQRARSTDRQEWEEYSQVRFEVTSYGSEVAEAQFRALRKSYTFDPETGEKHFVGSRPEVHNIIFRKIGGVWKVSDLTVHIIND